MKSPPLNYITIITNIHIEQSMHINVSIPVTITHVKTTEKWKEKSCAFVDTMIMLAIFISSYNEESLRSSNKLVNFFKTLNSYLHKLDVDYL